MNHKILFLILLICVSVFSDYMNDINLIPIITHSPGDKETFWKTDCFIKNYSSQKIKVRLRFYPISSDEELTYDMNFEEMEQKKIEDIVMEIFEMEESGYFIVDASNLTFPSNSPDVPIATQCRIYNTKEDGSTYGQSIPDQFFESLWPYEKEGILIGIINNDRYRTNFGLACNFYGSDIKLTYYGENNEILGEETIFIDKKRVRQFRFPYQTDKAWIKIEMLADDFCLAYTSIIDNLSGDAAFFSPFFELNSESEKKKNLLNKLLKESGD